MYEYEIEIRTDTFPSVPKKFISYNDMLVYITFNRYDSTISNGETGELNIYTRLDSLACWLLIRNSNICYKISSLSPNFVITNRDSTKNLMEGGIGEYVFDKELKDTVVDGVQYSISDSTSFSRTDSLVFRYFFVRQKINTVYDFLQIRHKNSSIRYAGFTMDDYKNKYHFTNLIMRLKEADPDTKKLCKAIYSRFKKLTK